ncbi:MAG: hypothetical protein HOP23_14815 [Methylococcaceae bacterium]|nr:hypothetical protein [Methylococcaceae bacterium]
MAFRNIVCSEEKANWLTLGGEEKVLHKEVPGLINWLMGLTIDKIRNLLENPPASTKADNREAMLYNNAVAHWLVEHCEPDPEHHVLVGGCKEIRNGRSIEFENADRCLFPSYLEFCKEQNIRPMSQRRFTETLQDAARTLGKPVQKKRMPHNGRTCIKGVRLINEETTRLNYW